jgi:hypothetical protein
VTSLLCAAAIAFNGWMALLPNIGVVVSSSGRYIIGTIVPETFVAMTGVDAQNPSKRPMCSTSWTSGGDGGGGATGGGGVDGGNQHGLGINVPFFEMSRQCEVTYASVSTVSAA